MGNIFSNDSICYEYNVISGIFYDLKLKYLEIWIVYDVDVLDV